jgi:hypothetical protein
MALRGGVFSGGSTAAQDPPGSSCAAVRWRGPPAWYSPYRRYCFEAPFVTAPGQSSAVCSAAYGALGGCVMDADCDASQGEACTSGQCAPAPVVSGRPVVVQRMAPSPACPAGALAVREAGGALSQVCPLAYENGSMPQCQNAFKSVWQAERYRRTDQVRYKKAKEYEACFVYDAQFPNGLTHPVSVRMGSAKCAGAAVAAQRKTAFLCVTAQVPGASAQTM